MPPRKPPTQARTNKPTTKTKTKAKAKPKAKTASQANKKPAQAKELVPGAHGNVKYSPLFDEQVRKLGLLGATDSEVAEFFGVTRQTLHNWRKQYPTFKDATEFGKTVANMNVAAKLYDRAMGYEYVEQVPIKLKEVTYKDGKRVKEVERVEVVEIVKVVPPDTTAIIFFLKNRDRKNWRTNPEDTGNTVLIPLNNVSNDEIIKRLRAYDEEHRSPSSVIDGAYTVIE